MLPETDLQKFYPVIMTPSHDGKFFYNYTHSLLTLTNVAHQVGMRLDTCLIQGESLITRARNNCVASFLDNKHWTHLVFIDSDIGFSPSAFFRLLLSDYDICAGIYALKKENWPDEGIPKAMTKQMFDAMYTKYTVKQLNGSSEDIMLTVTDDGFMKIDNAPTGFMCIKRSVLEKMVSAYPEKAYVSDSDYGVQSAKHYNFFDVSIHPETKQYLSEDYHFCHLWQQVGGDIFVDVQSNLTHQGSKIYGAAYAETLVNNPSFAISSASSGKLSVKLPDELRVNERPSLN